MGIPRFLRPDSTLLADIFLERGTGKEDAITSRMLSSPGFLQKEAN